MDNKVNPCQDLSRVERLRAIVELAEKKESVTAFGLAIRFGVSLNVIYKDFRDLRETDAIPADFELAKKKRRSAVEML